MFRRFAALVAAVFVLSTAPGLAEDHKPKLACATCATVAEEGAEKCEKDGKKLVRSDLVVLHNLFIQLGNEAAPIPGGHDNPFKKCVKDGDLDVEALEKLVQDYKAARKNAEFKTADLFGMKQARQHGNEASAIGALKTICTSQSIFREGDKDDDGTFNYGDLAALGKANLIDSVLGSGKKQGYVFECHPSTDKEKREFCWWATASPQEPGKTGERYFFTNQAGVIYFSKKPIKITDKIKESCEVPEGLTPVGR
jgi:hypothetical protein